MNNGSICPCNEFVFPTVITTRAGQSSIVYRVGDFSSFRHALLLPREGEVELLQWRPSATQDLAVQMVEWWAYLADILTFYNERIANEDYLRTAALPESVSRLIGVLGYRPRPGIGATATLAALLSKPVPLQLPKGLQIQSKPGPGQQPQIFELDADTTISPPDAIPVDPAPNDSLLQTDASGNVGLLLAGAISGVSSGDELLLVEQGWNGTDNHWAVVVVSGVTPEKDAHGNTNTRVTFDNEPTLPDGAVVQDYRLLKNTQYARPWHTASASLTLTNNSIDLDSIVRAIKVGDPILFEVPGTTPGPQLVSVSSYTEVVWYANADPGTPDTPPTMQVVPIPIPHSEIGFVPDQGTNWSINQLVVRCAWQAVGQLVATPAPAFVASASSLVSTPPASFTQGAASLPVMIEDANSVGASALASVAGSPSVMTLSDLADTTPALVPPLRVLYGLLQVSRGKTVANEILGSGDATQAGQEFVLQNMPLTYLLGTSTNSGQNYSSTLVVSVDGIAWQEVSSFYGQAPTALIFVTREDENNQTHVMFGDGINGARLTSGVNNVVANYRFGSGAASPAAGLLNVVVQPQPNLKGVRNPVAAMGGADPDPANQIRRYAPQSVLTFGRAISADDYETIAAQAPGVARARAYWAWDPGQQRALVTIYVGDDAGAAGAAQTAIALADDPNRPVAVKQAQGVPLVVTMTLLVDPRYDPNAVMSGVRFALIDPETGLLGTSLSIGQTLYASQIYQTCLGVPGAVAVHGLEVAAALQANAFPEPTEQYAPGIGGFFQLADDNLTIVPEVADYAQ